MYYVYQHVNPANGNVFYTGAGNKLRPYNFTERSLKYLKYLEEEVIDKGFIPEVRILHKFATWQEALEMEAYEIAQSVKDGYSVTNIMNIKYKSVVQVKVCKDLTRESVGDFIKAERKLSKISQGELAALANVSLNFISQLECNKETVRLDKIRDVVNVFGYDVGIVKRRSDGNERT